MKFKILLPVILFFGLLALAACGSDSAASATSESGANTESAAQPADPSAAGPGGLNAAPAPDAAAAPAAPSAAPAPATTPPAGVKHYTCPKNCKGSGGDAAGTCPVCGTAYVHNAAFHGQPGNTPNAATPGATATPVTPPAESPAKNAAGVFHYTCPKGCKGGAGAAGKCASCGGDLAHNSAYHNN